MPCLRLKKVPVTVATIAVLLFTAAPAMAVTAGASQDAYGGQGEVLSGTAGDGVTLEPTSDDAAAAGAAENAPASAIGPDILDPKNVSDNGDGIGSLPFTGIDVLALFGGGIVLVLLGMSVRQVTRRRPV